MRAAILLVAALALLPLLAGCSQAPETAPGPTPTDDDAERTARGGGGDEEEVLTQPVEILRTPLTLVGQGPETFEVTVPEDVESVDFDLQANAVWNEVSLRVELSGCGAYDRGIAASGGGSGRSDRLCGSAAPGPQAVTVSGTLVTFDGTFIVTANVRLA